MRRSTLLFSALLLICSCATVKEAEQSAVRQQAISFNDYFNDRTMRFNFHHAGDACEQHYYYDNVMREGAWAGSKTTLICPFNYGEQRFKIIDAESGAVIYENGYCTLFNEWQTTEEAKNCQRSYPEAVIFPEPKRDFIIEFYARNSKSKAMEKMYSQKVKVDDYNIQPYTPLYESIDIHIGGDISKSLDIVLLGDGYTDAEKDKFLQGCKKWCDALFGYEPFTHNKHRINVRAVWSPSRESGVSIPGAGKWVDNILESSFYTLGSERYQMTENFQKVRDIAASAPYESIFILTNSDKYGGGGIYNFYGLGSAGETGYTGEVFVHEFGHSLMGLGDEYVEVGNTVSAFYPSDKEPWEANLTTLVNFKGKWEDLIAEDTPIPTPLSKDYLNAPENWRVGVYEGGGYLEKGVYRPWPQCMMNQLYIFCPACQNAIEKYLDYICE